ncbi:MAG: PIG-L family deacetylase [Bryobacteraceae bacterium]|nr:PIG-L family deacetylase [Bryobacteraceae bacterium]MDW8378224.1 PIG-L family deacetylase [Bryobacterales bacterium]
MSRSTLRFFAFWLFGGLLAAQQKVLVISADSANLVLSAGGLLAGMARAGADVWWVRVTNDEKDSWKLAPEETALRSRRESEAAAKLLGFRQVIHLGYRAGELAETPFTTLRDRLVIFIRHYRPNVLFIPNPYTEYDRVLDRFYTGRAAEDAWRAAAIENFVPPFTHLGLAPHRAGEIYYYAQPLDPQRRQAESTSTFVPQPKVVDITPMLETKIRAAQALTTSNEAMAQALKARLETTGRRLPLLDTLAPASIQKLVEENVRGLAKLCAQGTSYSAAEEFHYAGVEFRIPRKYRE